MIEKHTCQNGLRVVLERIPTVRSVTIGIWILTGSRHEHGQINGISHFLEHMFFKGTKTRSAQDIAEEFDAIGGQVNAFTSKEYTCLYAKVVDTYKHKALDILADMFFQSEFQEAEMDKEKNVVYEEIKMYEDTPDDLVHDLLARAAFGDHPLGLPILGTEEQLATFTPMMLKEYMQSRYTPENVVVSIAGNVDTSFLQSVEGYFGNYHLPKSTSSFTKPQFLGEKIERYKDTEQAHVCLGFKGLAVHEPAIYSLIILNNVLGGSMSSRLFQDIREKKGLAYSVFSYHASFIDSGLLTIYAGTAKDRLQQLLDVIKGTIDEFVTKGITDKELQNSKEQLKGSLLLSLESTTSRMNRNGKNELILKKHYTLDELVEMIDAVNHNSVQHVMDTVFQQSPSIALISPKNE
ncbi:putative zinc protease YmxG [Virgibacillus pantothenticus]|uniref:Zinc protease n=1 Tax=Virgibacillus pantothenticus TaxID=1473 RepID=A0A0L0QNP8_VIRPA|nr:MULTISPECIES: pitrilysin family protein [Virgibacillus]API93933.1 peptidase M16 [Virgibacillus sp. 6R]KNE20217.1 zinc protease [Virgibacillus pantothenticus]MBS7427522.1 insulinase family protein [Virgibacillus sp. 19R1-5]MBU8565988.1 insulinase family protein [Virgibacillus pantothenticus]MBU8600965.1 insulinase family protein [Virgibacillus pantothenticus]